MAYDERLAERVRDVVAQRPDVVERKMFGGLAWMVGRNMACGVMGDDLVVRIAPDEAGDARREPQVREFGRPGKRPMRGFVLVEAEALAGEAELARWVDAGADHAASLPPK
jgi:TfoX/Sxy family transcriptional regulator of competence genes